MSSNARPPRGTATPSARSSCRERSISHRPDSYTGRSPRWSILRNLHDIYRVTVLLEHVVDLFPAGTVRETTVHESNRNRGSSSICQLTPPIDVLVEHLWGV